MDTEEIQLPDPLPEIKRGSTKVLMAIVSIVFVTLLVIILGYFYIINKNRTDELATPTSDVIGEYINSVTTRLLEEVSAEEQAKLKQALGIALFIQEEPEKGMVVLRDISQNTSYSNKERGLAIQLMGDMFLNYSDGTPTVAKVYLFSSTEPFASMMETEDREGLRKGLFRLYTYATELYPTAISEYRIAEFYAKSALETTSGAEKELLLTKAVSHWENGNALLPSLNTSTPDNPTDDLWEGYGLRLRGILSEVFFSVSKNPVYAKDARVSLNNSRESLIRVFKSDNKTLLSSLLYSELEWTDLYYVSNLIQADAVNGRARINELNLLLEMRDFYPYTTTGFRAQLTNLTYPFAPSRKELSEQMHTLVGSDITVDTFLKSLSEGTL